VPPNKLEEFLSLAKTLDVEATDLGEYTDDGFLTVMWEDAVALFLPLDFLHDGVPKMHLTARWDRVLPGISLFECPADLTPDLMALMGRFNICSKERLIRQYDHEVQAGTVVKPLVGVQNDGPGDAAVVRPLLDRFRGVAVGCGIAPRYSDLDTYCMMASCIDEAVRNIVAVGADPDHMAGLDNFCWCDPVQSEKTPDGEYKLAQLVRANKALYDVTTVYRIPCISGKDSMKNDYSIGDHKISIPPTVLFTAVGIVPDVRKAVTPDFKRPGDTIYVLGETWSDMGGSEYFALKNCTDIRVPMVLNPEKAIKMYRALHKAMVSGLVASCHDLSDGGLGVSLAESAFSGGLGATISLAAVPKDAAINRDCEILFSETPCRFLVSVHEKDAPAFDAAMRGFPCNKVGQVLEEPRLKVTGVQNNVVVDADIWELKRRWQEPLGV
jgi:phosphoribosylformylglycinamidine synthase